MGWLRKESSTHFERDESGRVVSVERSGDKPSSGLFRRESRTPVSDKLLSRVREEKKQAKSEARARIREKNRVYREEYEKARHQAKVKRMRRGGGRAGGTSPWDRLSKVSSMSGYSTRSNFNPFGSMFDTGLGYKKPSVKKKGKKKKSMGFGGFDMMDNWGFMK